MKQLFSITMVNERPSKEGTGTDVNLFQRTILAMNVKEAEQVLVRHNVNLPEFMDGLNNGGWKMGTHNIIPMASVEKPLSDKTLVNAVMCRMKENKNDKLAWSLGKKVLSDIEINYLRDICKDQS